MGKLVGFNSNKMETQITGENMHKSNVHSPIESTPSIILCLFLDIYRILHVKHFTLPLMYNILHVQSHTHARMRAPTQTTDNPIRTHIHTITQLLIPWKIKCSYMNFFITWQFYIEFINNFTFSPCTLMTFIFKRPTRTQLF